MTFWIVAIALSAVVGMTILAAMLRGGATEAEPADFAVYRDQLAAVDRDVARNIVTEDEAERLRIEIKRRLLEADRAERRKVTAAPRAATLLAAALSVVVIGGGAALGYMRLGAPGYPDQPLNARLAAAAEAAASRPSQAVAEAAVPSQAPDPAPEFLALMTQLREAVAARPDDRQGLRLLAENEARLGNYDAARQAQQQLVDLQGDAAAADTWAILAQLHLLADEGVASPEMRAALQRALGLSPQHGLATYLSEMLDRAGTRPVPQPATHARRGDFAKAHAAQADLIAILGDQADAGDHADHADLMILAAGGYVSPEAEAALAEALARDPQNGTARYYQGLLHSQTGRPDLGFRMWDLLLRSSTPDAPWVPPIRAQIEQLALAAGIDYILPEPSAAPQSGPDADQVAAAEAMSPAERMEMIQGMVTGLAERLATEGGPPEDWARLIRAYGVLGRQDAAAAIWAEAQTVFPDDITRVPVLQAARDAGVAQ